MKVSKIDIVVNIIVFTYERKQWTCFSVFPTMAVLDLNGLLALKMQSIDDDSSTFEKKRIRFIEGSASRREESFD